MAPANTSRARARKRIFTGLGFLAPNILGFLTFTLVPLVLSLVMAFTNWDLRLHSIFKDNPIRFIGIDNVTRLVTHPDFYKFFGNTLFFMIGIPFGIAGSLFAAILLNQNLRGKNYQVYRSLLMTALVIVTAAFIVIAGLGASGMTLLIVAIFGLSWIGGTAGGTTVYRTLFYTPHFTAGVATFLLWKKLYNPTSGPFSLALQPVLSEVESLVLALPSFSGIVGMAVILLLFLALYAFAVYRLAAAWVNGDLGSGSGAMAFTFLALPLLLGARWLPVPAAPTVAVTLVVLSAVTAVAWLRRQERLEEADLMKGFGSYFMFSLGLMTLLFVALGLSLVAWSLPDMAARGLEPPQWLGDYHWAKPSIMMMGLWGAIGSNNMILYLAGLSNIPQDLYEAADIDGARPYQKFWFITWPQLAPVTFFIFVMSIIGGLQGGFEMARTMTQGGPAGATTTLSYYIYTEGFETGRLGYASGVAWTLFVLVFLVTLFNWKFGNRYVND